MKQTISKDRTELAQLLTRLVGEPDDTQLRYQAARLALRVALEENDSSASDLLDSLLATPSSVTTLPHSQEQLYLRATARAARRAIVSMEKSAGTRSANHLLKTACADPTALRDLIRKRIEVGQLQLAQCISRVGISRHPSDPSLQEIGEEISVRLQETLLPAPIPFPVQHQ